MDNGYEDSIPSGTFPYEDLQKNRWGCTIERCSLEKNQIKTFWREKAVRKNWQVESEESDYRKSLEEKMIYGG